MPTKDEVKLTAIRPFKESGSRSMVDIMGGKSTTKRVEREQPANEREASVLSTAVDADTLEKTILKGTNPLPKKNTPPATSQYGPEHTTVITKDKEVVSVVEDEGIAEHVSTVVIKRGMVFKHIPSQILVTVLEPDIDVSTKDGVIKHLVIDHKEKKKWRVKETDLKKVTLPRKT